MDADIARMFQRQECSFFIATMNFVLTDPNFLQEVGRWLNEYRTRLRVSTSLVAAQCLATIPVDCYCLDEKTLTAKLLQNMRSAIPYYLSSTAATQMPRDAGDFLKAVLKTLHSCLEIAEPLPLRFSSFVTLQNQVSASGVSLAADKMKKSADREWEQLSHIGNSPIHQLIGCLVCTCIQCLTCRHTTTSAKRKFVLNVTPPTQRSGDTTVISFRTLFEAQYFRQDKYDASYDLSSRCAKGCNGTIEVDRTIHYEQIYLVFKLTRYGILFGAKNMTRVNLSTEIWIQSKEYRLIALICSDGLTTASGTFTTIQRESLDGETWRCVSGLNVTHGVVTADVFAQDNVLMNAYVALFRRVN